MIGIPCDKCKAIDKRVYPLYKATSKNEVELQINPVTGELESKVNYKCIDCYREDS